MSDWRETVLGPRDRGEENFRIKHWLELSGHLRSGQYSDDWERVICYLPTALRRTIHQAR